MIHELTRYDQLHKGVFQSWNTKAHYDGARAVEFLQLLSSWLQNLPAKALGGRYTLHINTVSFDFHPNSFHSIVPQFLPSLGIYLL